MPMMLKTWVYGSGHVRNVASMKICRHRRSTLRFSSVANIARPHSFSWCTMNCSLFQVSAHWPLISTSSMESGISGIILLRDLWSCERTLWNWGTCGRSPPPWPATLRCSLAISFSNTRLIGIVGFLTISFWQRSTKVLLSITSSSGGCCVPLFPEFEYLGFLQLCQTYW